MQNLYVVRHGQSKLNARRIFAGQLDTPLTDHGRKQAKTAGEQARSLGLDIIVSSPLIRALETAQIIARAADYPTNNIIANDLFMEQFQGSLQGTSWDEPYDAAAHDDMETEAALTARAQAGLDYLRSLDVANVLLVSHGSFCLALLGILKPGEQCAELPNAEILQII